MKRNNVLISIAVILITFSLQSCYSKDGNQKKHEDEIASRNEYYTEANTSQNDTNEDKVIKNSSLNYSRQNAITQAIETACPAVVGINVTEVRRIEYIDPVFDDPFFRRFFGGRLKKRYKNYQVKGLGSGFIISPDGYILTNHHVAGNASKILVTLTDGKKYDAKIIGSDIVSDVALLKIDGKDFSYLKLSNSDNVLTGEWVIAFGNPFGLFDNNAKPTVTVGVVSNHGVNLVQDNKIYKNMIQTDAAISSGNSGGPLINALGEVIGMNTVIFSTAQSQRGSGSIGIGFAIPTNRIKRIIDYLKENKEINRNFVTGIEIREIDEEILPYLNSDIKEGVIIFSINRKSSAEDAGFEPGDIILAIDGKKINKYNDYIIMVNDGIAGQKMNFRILRDNKAINKTLYLKPVRQRRR